MSEISEQEKKARAIVGQVAQTHVGLTHLLNIFRIAGGTIPWLTDAECRAIASESLHTFNEIRKAFPNPPGITINLKGTYVSKQCIAFIQNAIREFGEKDIIHVTIGGEKTEIKNSQPAPLDLCDAADAKRFRWLLSGSGYFMEENSLCGHGPCDILEQHAARWKIDEVTREEEKEK